MNPFFKMKKIIFSFIILKVKTEDRYDPNQLHFVIIVQLEKREIELIPTFCQHEKMKNISDFQLYDNFCFQENLTFINDPRHMSRFIDFKRVVTLLYPKYKFNTSGTLFPQKLLNRVAEVPKVKILLRDFCC